MLSEGEGGAGDRLLDAQTLGQPLHKAGLAGPQIPLQQQQCGLPRAVAAGRGCGEPLPSQLPAQLPGGGRIGQMAHLDRDIGSTPVDSPRSEPEASASPQIFPHLPPPSRELLIMVATPSALTLRLPASRPAAPRPM